MFAKFYPVAAADSPLRREIQRYIEFLVTADKVAQEDTSEKWDAFMEEKALRFIDLIETEGWYLKRGSRIELILIPNFCQNNGIVWSWNFSPDSEDALHAAQAHFANFAASLLQLRLF